MTCTSLFGTVRSDVPGPHPVTEQYRGAYFLFRLGATPACLCIEFSCPDAGLTELLPTWVAPNLITMVGMAGLIGSYFLFLFYLPTLEGLLLISVLSAPQSWFQPKQG